MTGKEWLEELLNHPECSICNIEWNAVDDIKRSFEILEIFKTKNINLELLKSCFKLSDGLVRYNKIWAVSDNCLITYQDKYLDYDEYNLLKEWL